MGSESTAVEEEGKTECKAGNKSDLCRIASLAFSFGLIPTSSDVWPEHLYIRDLKRKNQLIIFEC